MPKKPSIPASLRGGPFRYKEATQAGLTQYSLNQLIHDGLVIRLKHGLYEAAGAESSEEKDFESATLIIGRPSAICLISALSFYGLTDLIARKTWIMAPVQKRTTYPDLRVIRVLRPKWEIGIDRAKGYWITSLDRTLVDCLVYRKKIGLSTAVAALQMALSQRKTTLGKVSKMATDLGVFHRILPIIEVLA